MRWNHPEGSLKPTVLAAPISVPDSLGLEWSLRICISSKFPGMAKDAALALLGDVLSKYKVPTSNQGYS